MKTTTGRDRYTKLKQSEVDYQTSPKGTQQCSRCSMYLSAERSGNQEPSCTDVAGPIYPSGWCRIFDWRKVSA